MFRFQNLAKMNVDGRPLKKMPPSKKPRVSDVLTKIPLSESRPLEKIKNAAFL